MQYIAEATSTYFQHARDQGFSPHSQLGVCQNSDGAKMYVFNNAYN
jgi:hypothetical protein